MKTIDQLEILNILKTAINGNYKVELTYQKTTGVAVNRVVHPYIIGKSKYKHEKVLLCGLLEGEKDYSEEWLTVYQIDIQDIIMLDQQYTTTTLGYNPKTPLIKEIYCATPLLFD